MAGLRTVCTVLLAGWAVAGSEERVGAAGRREPDMQGDIIQAMKESGVLEEMQEKLDKQLFPDENSIEGASRSGGAGRRPVITPQEREMLRSFVDEYKSDGGLVVDTDTILAIVERVQKTPRPNLPQIFVQLGPIIEVVSAISQKTKDVQRIVDRQAPVFDSPAKPKDVLHTLAENLKSELVRLTLDTPAKRQTLDTPAKRQTLDTKPKAARKKTAPKAGGGLDMADYLSLGANMLKGGNAGQMLKLLSGEADLASVLAMLPQLLEDGGMKDVLLKMAGSYLESSPYGGLIQQYGRQAMESEHGAAFLDGAWAQVESFVKSENGVRFLALVPTLLAAKDMDSTLLILSKEAEFNWSHFFVRIQNSDYRRSVLEAGAEYLVQAHDFVQSPPRDSMWAKVPIVLNGLLVSQRLPALDLNNPVESVTNIANKAIKLFTTWKLDLRPHVTSITDILATVYERQAKGNKFSSLAQKEKKTLVARILEEELVTPVQAVWQVYNHVKSGPATSCQEHLLCLVNSREFRAVKPLRPSESSPTRLAVTKAASLGASWSLALGDKEEYWRLYRAVYEGAQGSDCMALHPPVGRQCDLFPWQKADFMNTNYDHVEL